MALWYYGKDGDQLGPVDETEMRAMLAAGTVDPTTLVWTEGMRDWRPLAQVPEWNGQWVGASGAGRPLGMAAPTNGTAVASMVCGICSILMLAACWLGILTAIPAVVCGHLSLGQLRNSGYPQQGKGMAIAGLATGYTTIGITLLGLAIFGAVVASGSLD